MGECATMTAACMTVTIDGREWTLSPVTLEDLGMLERWIESRPIRMVQSALDGLADRERQYLLALAFGESIKRQTTLGTESGRGELESIESVAYLFWLSLRVRHPDVTREVAARMLRTDNVELIKAALDKASGLQDAARITAEGPSNGRGTAAPRYDVMGTAAPLPTTNPTTMPSEPSSAGRPRSES